MFKKNSPEKKPIPFDFSKLIKRFIVIIPIGVLVNLVFSFSVRDKTLLKTITHFSSFYLAVAILLILIPWFANTTRLYIWTQFLNAKLSFLQVFKIILVSEFGAAITPSAVGSAPVKTGMLIEKNMPAGTALSLATISSVEDFAFFVFAIPTAFTMSSAWRQPEVIKFFNKFNSKLPWLIVIILFIMIAAFAIKIILQMHRTKHSKNPKRFSLYLENILERVRNVWRDFKTAYRVIQKKGKIRFISTTLLTGIQWICRYSVITALLASLGMHTDPVLFFVLQWIVFVLSAFIPTPGATGGAEASFYFIFYSFLPGKAIGLITAGWRFLSFYSFLGVGLILYYFLTFLERFTKKYVKQKELVFAD